MRIAFAVTLLIALALPVFAHDGPFGFMNCYSGKHCYQNTLVFGQVVSSDAASYTVKIQKVLRGKAKVESTVTLIKRNRSSGINPLHRKPQTVVAGDAIAVSFLQNGRKVLQPCYLLRSKTATWDSMTADTDYYTGYVAAIERFVRSGGVDDDYNFVEDRAYLLRKDGTSEQIYPVLPTMAPAGKPANTHRQRLPLAVASGSGVFLGFVLITRARRRKDRQCMRNNTGAG